YETLKPVSDFLQASRLSKASLNIDQPRRSQSIRRNAIRKASPRIDERNRVLDRAALSRLDLSGEQADERRERRDASVERTRSRGGEREWVDARASARCNLNDLA